MDFRFYLFEGCHAGIPGGGHSQCTVNHAVVHRLLGVAKGHQTVDQAGGKAIAAANTIQNFQSRELHGLVDLAVCPANGFPIIDGGGLYSTQSGGDHLKVGVRLGGGLDHLVIAVHIQALQVLVVALNLQTKASGKVLFIADHDINILGDLLVHFLGLFLAADALPQRGTVIQVVRHHGAVLLGSLYCLQHHGSGILRQSGVNPAGVQPAHTQGAKNIIPIHIAGLQLRNGGVAPVRGADSAANAVAPLHKVQSVAHTAADAVKGHPADQGGIYPALEDQILQQVTHLILCKSSDHAGAHSKAAAQPAGHIILAAALPSTEGAGSLDPSLARVQAQHDLAQRNLVELTFFLGS